MKLLQTKSPWLWVPSSYIAEGIPSAMVTTVATVVYKDLGIPNDQVAFWTSWLYLPWVLKPLWSPLVDLCGSKRNWMRWTQLFMGVAFIFLAMQLTHPYFFLGTMLVWYGIAVISATHDIACDGMYLLGLDQGQQAFFSGIRSTFFRIAILVGTGAIPFIAGTLHNKYTYSKYVSWELSLGLVAILFFSLYAWHSYHLPYPQGDHSAEHSKKARDSFRDFFHIFASFFQQKEIIPTLSFLLYYRLGEAQLVKLAIPFLMDARTEGGLGLTADQVGIYYGTFGVIGLLTGGILSGFLVSQGGLKKWVWWMAVAINFPDIFYVYMSYTQPESHIIITTLVTLEQFGYGFGFTGYMIFMMSIAKGQYKAAHYAIATGFMALGMMLPGMFSGFIQSAIGYPVFFIWVCFCTIFGFIIIPFLDIPPEFGKLKKSKA